MDGGSGLCPQVEQVDFPAHLYTASGPEALTCCKVVNTDRKAFALQPVYELLVDRPAGAVQEPPIHRIIEQPRQNRLPIRLERSEKSINIPAQISALFVEVRK